MSYGGYGYRGNRGNANEKAWSRAKATAWDDRWHALSIPARRAFLDKTKGPARAIAYTKPSTLADNIMPETLAELVAAGFVEVEKAVGKKGAKAIVPAALFDFAARIRAIYRFHLLGPDDREELTKYCRAVFYDKGELVIARVLANVKVQDSFRLEAGLERYVTSHRWPAWAVDAAKLPMAGRLVDTLLKAPGPVRLVDLAKTVGKSPSEVTEAFDGLLDRLALFEDVDPTTFEIVVGLLPLVRKRVEEASKPRVRPPLAVVEKLEGHAPQMGLVTNDLRVFLLEIIAQAPRLRQDGGLFVKDEPRLLEALPAWPDWLVESLEMMPAERLLHAFDWAIEFKFVTKDAGEDRARLNLTTAGRAWLAADIEAQYAKIYDYLRAYSTRRDHYYYHEGLTAGDALFLGTPAIVTAAKKQQSSYSSSYYDLKPEDRQALRDAISKAMAALPMGQFVELGGLLDHLAFGPHNPLMLGKKDPESVTVSLGNTRIPQLEERIETAGRILLKVFITRRLLLFDAMQAAVDDQGQLCVARQPRMDGYFGRKYKADGHAAKAEAKVVVQPDFSIVVIGLNPAPAVDLAPFCDRSQGQAGQGAMIFKITRESVVRAVSQGMKGAEILARLNKHASVPVPANVLSEVREWSEWTRLVNVRPITVVRCPDAETVARVVSALGRQAEKLGDTLVGLSSDKLSSVDRAKLQANGIIITKADITIPSAKPAAPPTATAKATASTPKRRGRPPKAR